MAWKSFWFQYIHITFSDTNIVADLKISAEIWLGREVGDIFSFLKICISVSFPISKILAYPFPFMSESAVLFVFLTLERSLVMSTPPLCICWPIANLSVGQNRSIGRAGCWISGEWQSTDIRVKLWADMLKKSLLCAEIWVNRYPSNKCHKFSSII